jgi:transcriptional regulator with XRE-family HTH domain
MLAMSKVTDIIKALTTGPTALSQSEIARRTGISQSRISRWGAGEVPSSLDDAATLHELAIQVGLSLCKTELSVCQGTKESDRLPAM